MKSTRFKEWREKQIFYGNPPLNLYRNALKKLSYTELDNLKLLTKATKKNLALIKKIYLWLVSAMTIGLISGGVLVLRHVNEMLLINLLSSFLILILSYGILVIAFIFIIQSKINTVDIHLEIINAQIESLRNGESGCNI